MSQDRKRSLFASLFRSKNKREEELEAHRESRQKIEDRIREVLVVREIPELPVPDLPPTFEPAMQANTGFLELVYSDSKSVHPRALLQSSQFSTHLPQYESESDLKIAPAVEAFSLDPGQRDEFQTEPWRFRQRAANG